MDELERKAKKAAYMREYMRKNPDKRLAVSMHRKSKRLTDFDWAEEERERSRAVTARAPQKNRDRAKAWQLANPERYKEAQRKAHAKNKAARVAKTAQWRKDNPERTKILALDTAHRRRARKAGGDEQGCREVIAVWKSRPRFTCSICSGRFLTRGRLQVDHILPLSKGGAHVPSNLQPLCKPCNLAKGARLDYNA